MTKASTFTEIVDRQAAIQAAFWFKGRKQFVPLTRAELEARLDFPNVTGLLRNLVMEGEVLSEILTIGREKHRVYELSELGKARAASIIEARQ
jgi:hypothetical protein